MLSSRRLMGGGILLLALLSALGLHQSSLPLNSMSTAAPGNALVLGSPLEVRSDEWLRWSPDVITRWTVPDAEDRRSILEVPISDSVLGGGLDWVLNTDERVAGLLPLDQAFALWWWWPIFASGAAAALLLRRFGVTRAFAGAGAVLFISSPVNAWWSFLPSRVAWVPMVVVLMLDSARRRSDWRAYALAAGAGVLIARIPSSDYAPWSLVFSLASGALLADLWRRDRVGWSEIRRLLIAPATSLGLVALWWIDVSDRYRTLAGTEYPGSRRDSGGSHGIPSMWSGVFDGLHAVPSWSGGPALSNLSEVAMGWTIIVVPALALMISSLRVGRHRGGTPVLTCSTITVVILLIWSQFEWPAWLTVINPLVLVPGERVTQIIGMWLVIPVLVLLLRSDAWPSRWAQGAVLTTTLALGGSAVVRHRDFFPEMPVWGLVLVVVGTAVLLGLTLERRATTVAVSFITVLGVASIITVNPLVIGIGDLTDSESATLIRDVISTDGGRVASDDYTLDTLLQVNGAQLASGQQYWGPDDRSWKSLDPEGSHRAEWNRGTAYTTFAWQAGASQAEIRAPQPDIILIRIDPCATSLAELNLRWVVSSQELSASCLEPVASFEWRDATYRIWERER